MKNREGIRKVSRTHLLLSLVLICLLPATAPAQTVDSNIPEVVFVEGGTFMMGMDMFGTVNGEADAFTGATPFKEGPAHEVTMGPFYIGKYEITNEQYARFIDAGGYDTKEYWLIDPEHIEDAEAGWDWKEEEQRTCPQFIASYSTFEQSGWNLNDDPYWKNTAYSNQPDTPVLGASWHEAYAYCKWLSSVTGQTYRLPTEAEWEYAARGPESLIFPWGNEYLDEEEMCGPPGSGAMANCKYSDDYTTEPVGSYPEGVSPFGAYDMSGNVAERTLDWFQFLYYYSNRGESNSTDPRGPSAMAPPFFVPIWPFWVDPSRAIRSKGFNTAAMANTNYNPYGSSYPLRSSGRMFNVRFGGHYFIGFRVVKEVE